MTAALSILVGVSSAPLNLATLSHLSLSPWSETPSTPCSLSLRNMSWCHWLCYVLICQLLPAWNIFSIWKQKKDEMWLYTCLVCACSPRYMSCTRVMRTLAFHTLVSIPLMGRSFQFPPCRWSHVNWSTSQSVRHNKTFRDVSHKQRDLFGRGYGQKKRKRYSHCRFVGGE